VSKKKYLPKIDQRMVKNLDDSKNSMQLALIGHCFYFVNIASSNDGDVFCLQ
jgi:hypothetical protein